MFPHDEDAKARAAAHVDPTGYDVTVVYTDERGEVTRRYHPEGSVEDPHRLGDWDYGVSGTPPVFLRYDETVA